MLVGHSAATGRASRKQGMRPAHFHLAFSITDRPGHRHNKNYLGLSCTPSPAVLFDWQSGARSCCWDRPSSPCNRVVARYIYPLRYGQRCSLARHVVPCHVALGMTLILVYSVTRDLIDSSLIRSSWSWTCNLGSIGRFMWSDCSNGDLRFANKCINRVL